MSSTGFKFRQRERWLRAAAPPTPAPASDTPEPWAARPAVASEVLARLEKAGPFGVSREVFRHYGFHEGLMSAIYELRQAGHEITETREPAWPRGTTVRVFRLEQP